MTLFGLTFVQGPEQDLVVEQVVARIHLFDGPLRGGAVAVLDDALDVAVGVADDAAVAGRVVEDRRGQRRRRLLGLVLLDQRLEGLGPDQRTVAAQHERLAREILQMLLAAHDGVGGAQLLGLLHPDDVRRIVGKSLLDLVGAEPDDHVNLVYADTSARIEHIRQHGPAGHFVQHLRQLGVHPAAHARPPARSRPVSHKRSNLHLIYDSGVRNPVDGHSNSK